MITKKITSFLSIFSILFVVSISESFADQFYECATGTIATMKVGGAAYGTDGKEHNGGNNVRIVVAHREFKAGEDHNLDNSNGEGLFSLAVTAFSMQKTVTIYNKDKDCSSDNQNNNIFHQMDVDFGS